MYVSESEITGAAILIILLDILSIPVDLLPDNWDSNWHTLFTVTGLNEVNSDLVVLMNCL